MHIIDQLASIIKRKGKLWACHVTTDYRIPFTYPIACLFFSFFLKDIMHYVEACYRYGLKYAPIKILECTLHNPLSRMHICFPREKARARNCCLWATLFVFLFILMIECCNPSVISELSKNWSCWPMTRVMTPWSPFSCTGKYFRVCAEVHHLQVQCCSKSCTGCCQSPWHVPSCRANSAQQPSSMEDWKYMLLLFYCYNVLQVAWNDKKFGGSNRN